MVAMNETKEPRTIKDVACPHCYKLLPYPSVPDAMPDKYGRQLRTYYGWCFNCNYGYAVIQFEHKGRWCINKFQEYRLVSNRPEFADGGKWIELCPLPEPALIVTGPGGDYAKAFSGRQIDDTAKKICRKRRKY